MRSRGLAGVQLVISDAHAGLKNAIAAVLLGAAWQRGRVRFLRNVLAAVPKGHAEMVAAAPSSPSPAPCMSAPIWRSSRPCSAASSQSRGHAPRGGR